MHPDDAIRILGNLTDAFPTTELDEGQTEMLVKELALLHDAEILDAAVDVLVKREDRFPTIARIRSSYRTVAESRALATAALERAAEPQGASKVPTWVNVWEWHRRRTESARMEANPKNAGKRVEDRLPVRMRQFPQLPPPLEPDAYTWAEYEELERAWIDAGRPGIRSAAELVDAVTAKVAP